MFSENSQYDWLMKTLENSLNFDKSDPADGWLFLDLGRQYQDFISDKDGSEKPYAKGEYQLTIKGDWQIIQNGEPIESRAVKADETQEFYFTRMDNLVNNFPIKTISGVNLVENSVVFDTENDYQLQTTVSGQDDSLGLTVVQLDSENKPIAYIHHRYDEELSSLATIS
jgi:hypothetical protein